MPSKLEWYKRNLRQAVRGFWSGTLTYDQALEALLSTINRGLTQAFYQGASECGMLPDDLTPAELSVLANRIASEQSYIGGILDYAEGVSLSALYTRLDEWVTRYEDVRNQARVLTCGDQKLIWELGRTEKHCPSCSKLSGRVKRASFWQAAGVYPQQPPNPNLSCKGFRCQCRLSKTNLPITPGPLPFLP